MVQLFSSINPGLTSLPCGSSQVLGWWCGWGQTAPIHTTILIQASHLRWRGEKLPTTISYTPFAPLPFALCPILLPFFANSAIILVFLQIIASANDLVDYGE